MTLGTVVVVLASVVGALRNRTEDGIEIEGEELITTTERAIFVETTFRIEPFMVVNQAPAISPPSVALGLHLLVLLPKVPVVN